MALVPVIFSNQSEGHPHQDGIFFKTVARRCGEGKKAKFEVEGAKGFPQGLKPPRIYE